MKVILLKDIKKLGKLYEVKEVKEGFARNFLIPKNLVKITDEASIAWLEKLKTGLEKQRQEKEKTAGEIAEKLTKANLKFFLKSDKEGNVFGVINAAAIAGELKKQGIEIDKSQIGLSSKIKSAGEFEAPVDLGFGVIGNIKISVSAKKD